MKWSFWQRDRPKRGVDFWRNRAVEATIAVVLAFLVIEVSSAISDQRRRLLPPTSWFRVNEIFVPDHAEGTNPFIIYDRVIREGFKAFWIVEVQSVRDNGFFQNQCSGFGVADYSTDEILMDNQVPWQWFIGRECSVPPGTYRMRVSYTMKRDGWPAKEQTVLSNVFQVF